MVPTPSLTTAASRRARSSGPLGRVSRRRALALGLGVALGALAGSPRVALGRPSGCGTPPAFPFPLARPDLAQAVAPTVGGSPRRVSVDGASYRYVYRVDGRPEVVRGMGYNPQTADLAVADRRLRLARDLGLMRQGGVNTVVGWDPAEFDGLLLDVAAETGLGVALPLDFDFRADYGDALIPIWPTRLVNE